MNIRQAFPQIIQKAQQMSRRSTRSEIINQELKRRREKGDPLIIPPVEDHKQTFILLHGRGDSADAFGGGLLDTRIPVYEEFLVAFPHAKFIFPQAPLRKCIRQPGWIINQWFDNWGYDTMSAEKEEIKLEGLKESTAMLHDLIRQEMELVGAGNIVIGGLSQGCAASMVALLAWVGQPLGGYVGLCGHLPYRIQIREAAGLVVDVEGVVDDSITSDAAKAVKWLRRKLDLPLVESEEAVFRSIPAFTAHGDEDRTVPTQYGRDAAQLLKDLGAKSVYHEYQGLTHWYNGPMLEDFVRYLKTNSGWEE